MGDLSLAGDAILSRGVSYLAGGAILSMWGALLSRGFCEGGFLGEGYMKGWSSVKGNAVK